MSTASASVLLVDDHGLVRHGLELLLAEATPGVRVRSAGTLAEALAALAPPAAIDLVLLDLTLPDVHGMAGLLRLRDEAPGVPVVIVSAQDDRDTVLAALDAGAMGFISKAAPPEELKAAMREVLVQRRIHLPQSVSAPALHAAAGGGAGRPLEDLAALGLTQRQIEVLALVVQGHRNKEIARRLDISEVMVKKHITPALQALGVPDRTKLLVTLSAHGYRVPSVVAAAAG
jgi:DNA-binding NarL/FixJ family response regulator